MRLKSSSVDESEYSLQIDGIIHLTCPANRPMRLSTILPRSDSWPGLLSDSLRIPNLAFLVSIMTTPASVASSLTTCSYEAMRPASPRLLVVTHPLYRVLQDYTCPLFFSHSSGVKHFGVHACIAAISSLSVLFTNRCLANVVFFAKWEETMIASNI